MNMQLNHLHFEAVSQGAAGAAVAVAVRSVATFDLGFVRLPSILFWARAD